MAPAKRLPGAIQSDEVHRTTAAVQALRPGSGLTASV